MSEIFFTPEGAVIAAISESQMREVDRVAVEEFGLSVLQMMENAGRNLALNAIEMIGKPRGKVVVLAGRGGNGGGGVCCARHLHNRGYQVVVGLTGEPQTARVEVQNQLRVLDAAGIKPVPARMIEQNLGDADLLIDAIIGYSLRGAPRGVSLIYIRYANEFAGAVLSLDMPSGVDATTGETPGEWLRPARTLTLALPKTGLARVPGEIYLGDIGIPQGVFHRLGILTLPQWDSRYFMQLSRS